MSTSAKIKQINKALSKLAVHEECCRLCPRECGVNRKQGEHGFCQTGIRASFSHALPHMGEEPILSGWIDCRNDKSADCPSGSGTIFFSGCHLKCLFCQNYQLSWLGEGIPVSEHQLAETMLDLQARRALNINLVSPTHLIIPILRALDIAFGSGLHIPLVYNSNGYEKAEIIRELAGIIDVYLPDFKYYSNAPAKKYSNVNDYALFAIPAILEMVRQRPVLIIDEQERAQEGVIIRHLVLPGHTEDSIAFLDWLGRNIPASTGFSLMSQYQPRFKAPPDIRRKLTDAEYGPVLAKAKELSLAILFFQPEPLKSEDALIPDFSKSNPFNWND